MNGLQEGNLRWPIKPLVEGFVGGAVAVGLPIVPAFLAALDVLQYPLANNLIISSNIVGGFITFYGVVGFVNGLRRQ